MFYSLWAENVIHPAVGYTQIPLMPLFSSKFFIQLGFELRLGLELRVGLGLRVRSGVRFGCPDSSLARSGVCKGSQLLQRADLKLFLDFHAAFSHGLIEILFKLD